MALRAQAGLTPRREREQSVLSPVQGSLDSSAAETMDKPLPLLEREAPAVIPSAVIPWPGLLCTQEAQGPPSLLTWFLLPQAAPSTHPAALSSSSLT